MAASSAVSTTATAVPAHRAGLGAVLRSEWTKFRSVRSTYWSLLVAVALIAGLGMLIAFVVTRSWDNMDTDDRASVMAHPSDITFSGFFFGQLAICVLAVLVVSSEYSTGMIRVSLAAVPRRWPMLAAKAVIFAVVAFVVGTLVVLATFFASQAILSTKTPGATLSDPGVLRSLIGGGLYLAMLGLFSLGVAAILRHTAGAITTAIGVVFVLPIVASIISNFLSDPWKQRVTKYLPSQAGSQVFTTNIEEGSLGPWSGFAVFCVYTAVVLAVAFVLLQRRDSGGRG